MKPGSIVKNNEGRARLLRKIGTQLSPPPMQGQPVRELWAVEFIDDQDRAIGEPTMRSVRLPEHEAELAVFEFNQQVCRAEELFGVDDLEKHAAQLRGVAKDA